MASYLTDEQYSSIKIKQSVHVDVFVTIAMKIIFDYQPCFDTLILAVQMDVSPMIDVINKQHCHSHH